MMSLKMTTISILKALEKKVLKLKKMGNHWGHVGLRIDYLVAEHLWSHLLVRIFQKTKPQLTLCVLGGIELKRGRGKICQKLLF